MRKYYARDKKLREENKRKQREAKRIKKLDAKQKSPQSTPSEPVNAEPQTAFEDR
jgi:hypothetical protein